MESIKNIRKNIVRMAHYSHASHVGAALSIADIVYTLYFKILNITKENITSPDRDKFILSKGHACTALYSTLAEKGLLNKDFLNKYYIDHAVLPGHLDKDSVPGIDCSTGSLGHGLSVGVGMAIAKPQHRVVVLMGDGECNEGSVWEAVMLASQLKLKNLTIIVDANNLQGLGYTKDVIDQSNLAQRFAAFNLDTTEINGHNLDEIEQAINKDSNTTKAIVAHTTKGKGVSYMENELKWHYKSPNDEELAIALEEIEKA